MATMIALTAAIATSAQAQTVGRASFAPASMGVINVADDYGGYIASYMDRIDGIRAKRTPVAITGDCRSACTLYLGAGNVCVTRSATLRFHGPSKSGTPFPQTQFDTFSKMMARYYPEPIKNWFMTKARYRINGTYAVSGAELIRLGIPECG
ncbi:MAG: hypothetical protein P8X43_14160 [Maritimibacter sp.]